MKKFNSNSISRKNKYNGAGGAGGGGTASDIAYDNSLSGLVSQNVQQAIDELHDEIEIGNIYTTEEKKVGEWIDGRNVYRKVYTGLSIPSARNYDWKNIDSNFLDALVINCTVICNNAYLYSPTVTVNDSGLSVGIFEEGRTITDVILEYVKTTD